MYGVNKPGDEKIVAIFKQIGVHNPGKSRTAGRAIYDDVEACELRYPGSKNVSVFPATERSHWADDGFGSPLREVTYAERFSTQYKQFKAHQQQTMSGTPLDYLKFLTAGKKAELRALNIYTAEALAGIDGNELKNLGPGGRELKTQAEDFLANSNESARLAKLENDIAALIARNQVLEQDLATERNRPPNNDLTARASEYDEMSDEQLRSHVATVTGQELKGNIPRRMMIRMVHEHRQMPA